MWYNLLPNLPFVPCGTKCSHWAVPTTCNIVHATCGDTRPCPGYTELLRGEHRWLCARRTIRGSSSATSKRFLCHPMCPDRFWDTSSLILNGYRGSFPGENGRGVKLTTHLHLVSRLNIPSFIYYAFIKSIQGLAPSRYGTCHRIIQKYNTNININITAISKHLSL